jgi:hypothetical protein
MFQNIQSGFPSSLPDLEMNHKDGARNEVRLQEEAQTVLGWSERSRGPCRPN